MSTFSYQLGQRGPICSLPDRLAGVHMGAKGGRTSGRRLGYSQIANPVYLLRKKTIPPKLALRLIAAQHHRQRPQVAVVPNPTSIGAGGSIGNLPRLSRSADSDESIRRQVLEL